MESKYKKYKLTDDITMQVIAYTENMLMAKYWFTGPGYLTTHHHPNEETDVVVAGQFEATNGTAKFRASVGDAMQVGPNVEHNMQCLTPTGEMVTTWTPARQDIIEKYTELA